MDTNEHRRDVACGIVEWLLLEVASGRVTLNQTSPLVQGLAEYEQLKASKETVG